MYFNKHIIQYIVIISLIVNIISCGRLSENILSGWGEKIITNKTKLFSKIFEATEKYFVSEGYTLDETDILPFGLFKQTVNGTKYRLLCAVKKKSGDTPTIFDIYLQPSNNEFKTINAKKPDYSSSNMSEKDKKKMKYAIHKYYFEKLYKVEEIEIEYEYHKLDGLNDYVIYDVNAKVGNKKEKLDKRLLIVYRNDKTFTVEEELIEKE